MESPKSWNRLTATLAVCDLTNPNAAWAFAVVQGLVRDQPGDRDLFLRLLDEEQRKAIIGPGLAYRLAAALASEDIALPSGLVPDPWGEVAAARLEMILSWGGLDGAYLKEVRLIRKILDEAPAMKDEVSQPDKWKWWQMFRLSRRC